MTNLTSNYKHILQYTYNLILYCFSMSGTLQDFENKYYLFVYTIKEGTTDMVTGVKTWGFCCCKNFVFDTPDLNVKSELQRIKHNTPTVPLYRIPKIYFSTTHQGQLE